MYDKIREMFSGAEEEMRELRREFHRYPETAFMEIRTASIVAHRLKELGFEVITGHDACDLSQTAWRPSQAALDEHYQMVEREGLYAEFAQTMRDGHTAVIGILDCGEGPTVGFHCELDALPILETDNPEHRPNKEGYRSLHPGMMHACGHDGNLVVALKVAEALSSVRESLHGRVKMIFKPADERGAGAKTILAKGHLDDVDYLFSTHIFEHFWAPNDPDLDLTVDFPATFATTSIDADFFGQGSSAGAYPNAGRNVMLSVATAIENIQAIPRHGDGETRVNVGRVEAGKARNIIADRAHMEIDVRGQTLSIIEYMIDYTCRILNSAAKMHGTECEIHVMGGDPPIVCDRELAERMARVAAEHLPGVKAKYLPGRVLRGGADDYALMMERVREHGGQATDTQQLTGVSGGPHTDSYDFEESVLPKTAQVFAAIAYDLLSGARAV